ncbi:MAG: helix-turn-helix transcriptional regulator [Pseudomonadota bacterium]
MSKKFGEKLRHVRTSQRRTLEELAEAVGSSKAYVWQLENKKNAKPSAELLLKIANFLGESPDYFLDDTSDERTAPQRDDALFRKYRRLSEDDKRYIDRIVSGLDAEDKE